MANVMMAVMIVIEDASGDNDERDDEHHVSGARARHTEPVMRMAWLATLTAVTMKPVGLLTKIGCGDEIDGGVVAT